MKANIPTDAVKRAEMTVLNLLLYSLADNKILFVCFCSSKLTVLTVDTVSLWQQDSACYFIW
jgi:hypothetical protein